MSDRIKLFQLKGIKNSLYVKFSCTYCQCQHLIEKTPSAHTS